jgi:arylsulfatase
VAGNERHENNTMRGLLAAGLLAAMLAGCGGSTTPVPGGDGRPNVLVILADDLGYSDIGAYGSEIRTPGLDALAQQGAVFTNFHATPLCSPTRGELLTGADHHIVGVGALLTPLLPYQSGEDYEGLNDKARTIAQLLRDAGYHTYMAGKWHVSSKGPEQWGFEQSFYLQPDAGNGNNFPPAGGGNGADEPHYDNGQPVTLPAGFYSTDYYTDRLIADIDARRGDGKPFFAYLAVQATHNPLQAPDDYLGRYSGTYDAGYDAIGAARIARQKALGIVPPGFTPNPGLPVTALSPSAPFGLLNLPWAALTADQRRQEARQMEVYAAMLENMDANIGRLLDHLRQLGVYDNTLIVFLSDNGPDGNGDVNPSGNVDNSLPNYGRPGSYITRSVAWSLVSSVPFKGFKASVYEGGTSVPAIVRLPGGAGGHRLIPALTSVLDLAPTVLAAAGLPDPGTQYQGRSVAPLEGYSLLPLLRGESSAVRGPDAVLADEMYDHRYVVRGSYKLERTDPLYYGWSVIADHDWQLFDLAADRGENHVLDERDILAPALGLPGDPYSNTVNQMVADWQAYVQRTGLSLPPGQ